MKWNQSKTPVVLATALIVGLSADLNAQGRGRGGGPGGGRKHQDAEFVVDRDDFHFLLQHHDKITRKVTNREDGIETLTESDDPEVVARIQKHVPAMYKRLEDQSPVRMWDPLFVEIFRNGSKVQMRMEKTEKGLRVVETSADPRVVGLIQQHARVVSLFVKHGFDEAHRAHPVADGQAADDAAPAPDQRATAAMDQERRQFAQFDAVYIPALALTNKQDALGSKLALTRLAEQWPTFQQQWRNVFESDRQWPDDLERCGGAIARAGELLDDSHLAAAHVALEPVRDMLMRARRRNDFDYPLDALSDFHGTMEEIVKPAMKMVADDLTPSVLEELRQLATEADRKWSVVERTSFDDPALDLSKKKLAMVAEAVRAERQALGQLDAARKDGDPRAVLQAARNIKPPFAKLYMSFGSFSGVTPADSDSNDSGEAGASR